MLKKRFHAPNKKKCQIFLISPQESEGLLSKISKCLDAPSFKYRAAYYVREHLNFFA